MGAASVFASWNKAQLTAQSIYTTISAVGADGKLLIVYESSECDLKAHALKIKAAADTLSIKSIVKCADDVTIPEILAARAFAFGACKPDSQEYREITRIIKGINLAGRKASFFTSGSGKAIDSLKAMCADSELTQGREILDFSLKPNDAAIKAWLQMGIA